MKAREFTDYLVDSFREDMMGDTPIAGVQREGSRTLKVDAEDDRGAVTTFVLSISAVKK